MPLASAKTQILELRLPKPSHFSHEQKVKFSGYIRKSQAWSLSEFGFDCLKCCLWLGPHSRGAFSSPFRASYRGLARSENPGIHIRQNPAAPRNSRTFWRVVGTGMAPTACFLSVPQPSSALHDVKAQILDLFFTHLCLFL